MYPITFKGYGNTSPLDMHFHQYKFNSLDKKEFMRRVNAGLDSASRRLRQKMKKLSIHLKRISSKQKRLWMSSQNEITIDLYPLTDDEISYWTSPKSDPAVFPKGLDFSSPELHQILGLKTKTAPGLPKLALRHLVSEEVCAELQVNRRSIYKSLITDSVNGDSCYSEEKNSPSNANLVLKSLLAQRRPSNSVLSSTRVLRGSSTLPDITNINMAGFRSRVGCDTKAEEMSVSSSGCFKELSSSDQDQVRKTLLSLLSSQTHPTDGSHQHHNCHHEEHSSGGIKRCQGSVRVEFSFEEGDPIQPSSSLLIAESAKTSAYEDFDNIVAAFSSSKDSGHPPVSYPPGVVPAQPSRLSLRSALMAQSPVTSPRVEVKPTEVKSPSTDKATVEKAARALRLAMRNVAIKQKEMNKKSELEENSCIPKNQQVKHLVAEGSAADEVDSLQLPEQRLQDSSVINSSDQAECEVIRTRRNRQPRARASRSAEGRRLRSVLSNTTLTNDRPEDSLTQNIIRKSASSNNLLSRVSVSLCNLSPSVTHPSLQSRRTLVKPSLGSPLKLSMLKNKDNNPLLQRHESSPSLRKRELSPSIGKREGSPLLRKREDSPLLRNRDSSPSLRKREDSPSLRKRAESPLFKKREDSPSPRVGRGLRELNMSPTSPRASPSLRPSPLGSFISVSERAEHRKSLASSFLLGSKRARLSSH